MQNDIRDEALELLHSLSHIIKMIERLQEQIDITYSMLTSTTVKPKEVNVQTSGATDQMADRMASIIEWQQEVLNYQSELSCKKNIVLSVIKRMNYDEQNILTMRYISCMTIETIGKHLGVAYSTAWEKLHLAEENFLETYATDRIE